MTNELVSRDSTNISHSHTFDFSTAQTDFHPESWNPMWSVGTILMGLLSFMYDTAVATGTIVTSAEEKRTLALASLDYNLRTPIFRKLFPDWVRRAEERRKEAARARPSAEAAAPIQEGAAASTAPADPAAAPAQAPAGASASAWWWAVGVAVMASGYVGWVTLGQHQQ